MQPDSANTGTIAAMHAYRRVNLWNIVKWMGKGFISQV